MRADRSRPSVPILAVSVRRVPQRVPAAKSASRMNRQPASSAASRSAEFPQPVAGSFPTMTYSGTHVETKLDEEVCFGELEWADERHHPMPLRDGSDEYGPV